MNFQLNSESDKYAKLKMGLIPVLLVGFAYVVFAPESQPTPAPAVPTTEVTVSNSSEKIASTDLENEKVSKRKIPNISLAETTAHDPFALLPILRPEPKVEITTNSNIHNNETLGSSSTVPASKMEMKKQKELLEKEAKLASLKESIQQLTLQGIFASGNKRSVLINSRIFKEGDTLTEGIKILKINSHDVVLDLGDANRIYLK